MSASSLTPPTQRRHWAPAPRGSYVRHLVTSVLVGSALLLTAAACSGDAVGTPPPRPSSTLSPPVAPTPADEQAQLLAQYRKFWATLTPASRMLAAERRAVLSELAVDPALKSILFGMTQADAKGHVFYGADVPRPTVRINPDASTGLVDDCQDSSRAGVAERASGKRVTVGVARNHVSVTMKKQPGDLWKVAYVDYAKSPC
jgi:hypothetical protein